MNWLKKITAYLTPLITDADTLISVGRVSYWIVFLSINTYWAIGKDVPETMTTILLSLMGYEIFKKGRDVVKGLSSGDETET